MFNRSAQIIPRLAATLDGGGRKDLRLEGDEQGDSKPDIGQSADAVDNLLRDEQPRYLAERDVLTAHVTHHKEAGQAAEQCECLSRDQRNKPSEMHSCLLDCDTQRKAGKYKNDDLEQQGSNTPWVGHNNLLSAHLQRLPDTRI